MTDLKVCTRCGSAHPPTREFFDRHDHGKAGLRSRCRECERRRKREAARRRYATPRGREVARRAKRRFEESISGAAARKRRYKKMLDMEGGREKQRARMRAWSAANREKCREMSRIAYARLSPEQRKTRERRAAKRMRDRRQKDPRLKLRAAIAAGIVTSLKARGIRKTQRWERLVGYKVARLRAHLERQFVGDMAWHNYGRVWEIDHIVPVASFTWLSPTDASFKACWALSNLRPLWKDENRRKQARLPDPASLTFRQRRGMMRALLKTASVADADPERLSAFLRLHKAGSAAE